MTPALCAFRALEVGKAPDESEPITPLRRNETVRRLAWLSTTVLAVASCARADVDARCLRVAPSVRAAIDVRVAEDVRLGPLRAVRSHDPTYEQLYFISAVVDGRDVATWAVDSIDVVRSGPCASDQDCGSRNQPPLILNANAVARASTPSLRPNDAPEVPRPGGNALTAEASRVCAKRAADSPS